MCKLGLDFLHRGVERAYRCFDEELAAQEELAIKGVFGRVM